VLWIGLGASAEILRAVIQLKQDVVKELKADPTQNEDAVVTDVSYRTGSSVQPDDFTETFAFVYKSLDITKDCDLLSNWANGEFEAFKEALVINTKWNSEIPSSTETLVHPQNQHFTSFLDFNKSRLDKYRPENPKTVFCAVQVSK
jgi:hypothetical protein